MNVLPYLAGIGCSLCYGSATVLEQIAARRQVSIGSLHPAHLLNLFQQLPYISGIALDLIGWGLFLLAARTLPLFLVLSFVASSLVVTTVVAHFFLGVKTARGERLAMTMMLTGLILLGITAQPSAASAVAHHFLLTVELSLLPVAAVGLSLLRAPRNHYATMILAGFGGLAFGATGLLARIIHFSGFSVGQILQAPVLVLLAYGALGMFFLAAALQRGNINKVNGMLCSSELAVPSLLGVLFLGDRARSGLWPLMAAGFLCVIGGTIAIALETRSAS